MPLVLSQDERILLHLARYERYRQEWEVPREICQEGIGETLTILVNNVSRALSGMLSAGLVEERLAHMRGMARRRKSYFLTERGRRALDALERRLRATAVDVEIGGSRKEVPLAHLEETIARRVGRRPDLLTLVEALRAGRTREEDLAATASGGSAPTLAAFVESLLGAPAVDRFVGRDVELRRIATALEDPGRTAIVLWGLAGIGKSTLAAKAIEAVRGHRHLLWHRCTEWDTLRGLVAVLSAFLGQIGRSRLAGMRRLRWTSPSELLSPLHADLRDLPSLLIFDDLHRLPAESRTFLALLLEASRGGATDLLLLSRELPAFYARGEAGPQGAVLEIEVGGLSEEAGRQLLPTLPAEAFHRAWTTTHGHPFFLGLFAAGAPAEADLTRFLDREIYAKLSDDERGIIHSLAVHRLPVTLDALPRATPPLLGALRDRGLVRETGGAFEMHDLLRDFVRTRIPSEERRALHSAAAVYWTSRDAPEALRQALDAESWSEAASKALDVVPGLAEDDPAEAWAILDRLPKDRVPPETWPDLLFLRALSKEGLGDIAGALALYQEALAGEETRGGDKASLATLHQRIAQMQREASTLEETRASHRRAIELFEEAGDNEGQVLELVHLASLYRRHGKTAEARQTLDRAMKVAKKAEQTRLIGAVSYQQALALRDAGELASAAARLQESRRAAVDSGDRAGDIASRGASMEVEFLRGDAATAERLAEELARAASDPEVSSAARESLFRYARVLAANEEAALVQAIRACVRPKGFLRRRPLAIDIETESFTATLCRRLSRWEEMRAHREESLRAAWGYGRPSWTARELLEKGLDAEARGDLPKAVAAFEESASMLLAAEDRRGLVAVNLAWGRVLEKREDDKGAEAKYEAARRNAEANGDLLGRAIALEGLGAVTGPRGRTSLREAGAIYARLGRAEDEARVAALLER